MNCIQSKFTQDLTLHGLYNLGEEGLASGRKPKQDEKSSKSSTLKETFFAALCSLKNIRGELGELLKT